MRERKPRKEPILKFNRKLPANDDPHEWALREKKILGTSADRVIVKVAAHKEAIEKMASSVFDRIIISPVVLHLSNLLQLAQSRNLPTNVPFAATLIQKLGLAFLRCWLMPALSRKNLDGVVSPFSGTAAYVSELASLFNRWV